jgi:hypothetical protein
MWSLHSNALDSPSPMDDKDRFSKPLISTGYFTFILGRQVVIVETTALEDLRAEVRVRVDDDLAWNSIEPAWGGLGFGVIQCSLYWWSARRLVLLPRHPAEDVRSLQVDEDIHHARFGNGPRSSCPSKAIAFACVAPSDAVGLEPVMTSRSALR